MIKNMTVSRFVFLNSLLLQTYFYKTKKMGTFFFVGQLVILPTREYNYLTGKKYKSIKW